MACDLKSLISSNACLPELSGTALRTVMFGAAKSWALTVNPALDTRLSTLLAQNPCMLELNPNQIRTIIFQTLCNIQGGTGTCSDPDASSFLSVTGITDSTTVSAICTLVTSLKTAGVWALMDAIYPFVGGTSVTTSYNLKNPATFRITWHGSMTFNSSGVTGDGLTGYGDTGYNATTVAANYILNSASLSMYVNPAGNGWFIGASNGASLLARMGFITGVPALEGLNSANITNSGPNLMKGFYCATRTDSVTGSFYQPGNTFSANSASTALPSNNFYLCAENDNGTPDGFNIGTLSFLSIGAGLNLVQETAKASAVNAFQTSLSRN